MKFLLAPDSYKGSLRAKEVADCMEMGIYDVLPDAEVVKLPIADGGEGTVESIVAATNGTIQYVEVIGPLGESRQSFFGVIDDGGTAIIEMAAASGLPLVPLQARNPLVTTTYGTGQLIKAALDHGCKQLIIGVGGSATNDGGVGMAQALGAHFYNAAGQEVGFGGGQLETIRTIDVSEMDRRLQECEIIVASDVTNPLVGPNGASAVFGPQKGATEDMVQQLEKGLLHLADLLEKQLGINVKTIPGGGAAGGLGAGLIAFTAASIRSGIDTVLEATQFEQAVRNVDYVITGEGRTDGQTSFGKAPLGVARLAKKHGKPVICISGGITSDVNELYDRGMDVIIGATQSPMSLEDAMEHAGELVTRATSAIVRTLLIGQKYSPADTDSNVVIE